MKRGWFITLLLILALVLTQACVVDATTTPINLVPVAEDSPDPPCFMHGFEKIQECEEPQVGAVLNGYGIMFGSGVLIAPTIVLTAGHCADDGDAEWFMSGGEIVKIKSVALHPDYKIAHLIFVDLALLLLETPCSAEPSHLLEKGYSYYMGRDLVIVGYGGSIKRKSNPETFWYYGTLVERPTVFKFLPINGTIWFGDSGGAVYDSDGVLVGIISSLGIKRGKIYENSAVRLDIFLDWIREAQNELIKDAKTPSRSMLVPDWHPNSQSMGIVK